MDKRSVLLISASHEQGLRIELDWQLVKPKMHVLYKNDPPPDSEGFDVKCEHGNLGLNTNSRRRISCEVKTRCFYACCPLSNM